MIFEMSCKKLNPDIDRSITLDIYTHAFDKNKKAASRIMQSSLEI